MRVLFVDDERRVLAGIENALLFEDDDLEATFVDSGAEAVTRLAEESFDVLVTDMKMPGMSGADVLEHARANHPAMARVVLSGEVDADLAHRAMPLTHQFVSKPCDPEALLGIVRGVFAASRSLDSPIIAELVGGMTALPAQPRVFQAIQESIERDDDLATIALIVESDIAVATAVLRTANSAFYGFRSPARSVHDAVGRLGALTVAGIALNQEVAMTARPEIVAELETLNLLAAELARIVRRLLGDSLPGASLAALLRSIGVVALQTCLTDQFRPIQEHFNRTGEVDEAAELAIFGASHAEIGAYLLRMWNLDPLVVEVVQHHRDVASAGPEAARIIHAIAAADAAMGGREVPEWIDDELVAKALLVRGEVDR